MKVCELQPGQMLVHVHPKFRFYIEHAPASIIVPKNDDTIIDKFYARVAVVRHEDLSWISSSSRETSSKFALYLGAEMDDFVCLRTKKHHKLMIGDEVVLFSGYDFRRLEILQ